MSKNTTPTTTPGTHGTYAVKVREILERTALVKADSADEAEKLAIDLVFYGEVDMLAADSNSWTECSSSEPVGPDSPLWRELGKVYSESDLDE